MENQVNLSLTLRKDWDYFPHFKKQQGHFVGRVEEKKEVVDWFLRREKGCFLVSGERGVGKTALVYEALHEAIKQNDKIIPILINSSQLILEESISKDRKKGEINKARLEESIIINLIRRLYSEGNKKFKENKSIINDLNTLYRKAISEKSEIKEEFKLKRELERQEIVKKEINQTLNFDPEHVKFLVGIVGAVISALILGQKPVFGNFSWNIFIATITMLLPLSVYFKITKYLSAKKISGSICSVEELYITDRSISNLEYDLYSLLEKIGDHFKIIFVIDEMDKIEEKLKSDKNKFMAVEIIKTFKNLFTLSSGIFVFITAENIYTKVDEAKLDRSLEYTLFNDKVFLSRPSFEDLESYINKIISSPPADLNKNELYRNFRNLICYQAKSDFFELHFRIRDYIGSFDKENRPILNILQLSKEDILKANLQKAMGQIFNLHKYKELSNWYKNNLLLKELYCFLEEATDTQKIDFRKSPSTENEHAILIHQIEQDLVDYLSRYEYIYNRQEINKTIGDKDIPYYRFNLTGKVNDIGETPDKPLDYEDIFLRQLKRFAQYVNSIKELIASLRGEKTGEADLTRVYDNDIQQYCDMEVLSLYQEYEESRNKLERRPNPIHIPREELEKHTNKILLSIDQLNNQTITVLERLVKDNIKLDNSIPAKLNSDPYLFGANMVIIREGVLSNNLFHICFYRKVPKYTRQILVVKDMPEMLYDDNKSLINENSLHFLIININTKGVRYNLEYNANIPERKIRGFIDVPVVETFLNLKTIIDEINNFDKEMSVEERNNFLSQPIDDITLRAYTEWKFSGLPVSENIHRLILANLDSNKYQRLKDIEEVVQKAKPAVETYAKQKPDIFQSGSDYITKSLGFVDDDFLSKHSFSQETKDAIANFRHLIKNKQRLPWGDKPRGIKTPS